MKNQQFGMACGIGLAFVGLVVAGVLFMQRGARVGLTGNILKVRTAPLEDTARSWFWISASQSGERAFRGAQRHRGAGGKGRQAVRRPTIPEMDAKRLFEGLPLLGQKFNETLVLRGQDSGHSSLGPHGSPRASRAPGENRLAKRFHRLRLKEIVGGNIIRAFSERNRPLPAPFSW